MAKKKTAIKKRAPIKKVIAPDDQKKAELGIVAGPPEDIASSDDPPGGGECPDGRVEECEHRFQAIESTLFGEEPPPRTEPGAVTRYFVIIFWEHQQGEDGEPHLIDRWLYDFLHTQLDATIETPAASTEIDVWIDSGGGYPHIAYKMLLDLRSRCRTLRAVIPDYAKSAATLLVLGMDEIYMAASAELGPLDVQVAHPLREELTVSALDVSGAIDFIGRLAVSLAVQAGPVLLDWTRLARADILREVLPFAAKVVEPAVAQLDPHLVHRAYNQLRITREYAERALANRRLGEEDKLEGGEIKKLCNHLVTNYPSHAFVISRAEAKGFGLPVKELEEYCAAPLVNAIYKKYSEERKDVCQVVKAAGNGQEAGASEQEAATVQPGGGSEDAEADG